MGAAEIETAHSENNERFQDTPAETAVVPPALAIDPFEAAPDCFYPGAGRQRLLEQLLHYCQFSASLLVVLGEAGAGKSHSCRTLAARAMAEAADNSVCALDVPVLCSPEQLFADIARSFGLVADGKPGRLLSEIRHFGQAPEEQESLALILIDNAHNLDDQTLAALVSLLQGQEGCSRRLHIVMFAEPGLEMRLDGLDVGEVLIHDFHLQPLSQDEVFDYIDYRMELAGVDLEASDYPFDERAVAQIWRQSEGNIEAINQLGRQRLEELLAEPESSSLLRAASGLPVWHVLTASVLVSALLLLALYRGEWLGLDSEEATARKSESITLSQRQVRAGDATRGELPASQGSDVEPSAAGTKPSVSDTERLPQVAFTNDAKGSPAIESSLGQPLTPQSPAPAPTPVVSQPEASVRVDMGLDKLAQAPKPEPPKVESPAATVERVRSDAVSASSQATQLVNMAKVHSGAKEHSLPELQSGGDQYSASEPQSSSAAGLSSDEQILLSLPPGHYALQVLGAGIEQSVREFMQRQTNREALKLYTTRRKGREWYVVVVGNYASRAEAQRAIRGLPASQRSAGPWPRKLQTVQAEIRSFQGM